MAAWYNSTFPFVHAVCLMSVALHLSLSRRIETLNGLIIASKGVAFVATPARHARSQRILSNEAMAVSLPRAKGCAMTIE